MTEGWVWACACAQFFQLCLTLCNLLDCSPPGSSVLGILQARMLQWVAMLSSRGSCQPWQAGSLPLAPPGKPWVLAPLDKVENRITNCKRSPPSWFIAWTFSCLFCFKLTSLGWKKNCSVLQIKFFLGLFLVPKNVSRPVYEGWWWLIQPHDCGYGEDSGSLCQCSWLPPVCAKEWLVIWHHSACSGPSSSHWLTHPDLGGLGHQNLALTCVSLGSPGHLDPSVWPWGSFCKFLWTVGYFWSLSLPLELKMTQEI